MAFLDNSGDIILDAVLTDHGRKVLAKGDGSFQITKFALGDEEVNYTLYNSSHTSGSAYYDLQILQTPILESFTNNASSMKSQLITYDNMELLFLPVLKLNELNSVRERHSTGAYVVAVDALTEDGNGDSTKGIGVDSAGADIAGFLRGETLNSDNYIRVDQGLDGASAPSYTTNLDSSLYEDSYMIQLDSRLGSLVTRSGDTIAADYTDDDNISHYVVYRSALSSTATVGPANVTDIVIDNGDRSNSSTQTISGPRGSIVQFKIKSSAELNTNSYLFTQLGGSLTYGTYSKRGSTSGGTIYYIDTMLRVAGMKTGYSIDIPLRFVKDVTT
jgi:hypothetical protein